MSQCIVHCTGRSSMGQVPTSRADQSSTNFILNQTAGKLPLKDRCSIWSILLVDDLCYFLIRHESILHLSSIIYCDRSTVHIEVCPFVLRIPAGPRHYCMCMHLFGWFYCVSIWSAGFEYSFPRCGMSVNVNHTVCLRCCSHVPGQKVQQWDSFVDIQIIHKLIERWHNAMMISELRRLVYYLTLSAMVTGAIQGATIMQCWGSPYCTYCGKGHASEV